LIGNGLGSVLLAAAKDASPASLCLGFSMSGWAF
jgi:hypothetical protein